MTELDQKQYIEENYLKISRLITKIMTREELKIKEIIEEALLKAMYELDIAGRKMLSLKTETDNANYDKIMQAKTTVKRTLQRGYDRLARNRS